MPIVFYCQSCGARFEVDARQAGKKGRCKKCGQMMEIPRAEQLASMMALPALSPAAVAAAPAGVGGGNARGAAAPPRSLSSWLENAASSVGLAAITADRLPIGMRRKGPATPLDEAEDSKPYVLAVPDGKATGGRGSGAAGAAVRVWRREVGVLQRIFRVLNESAYFLSIPFIMIALFGVVVKSRNVALFGSTFLVLLSLGRIVAGVANLAVIPLRDGLHMKRMKKPLRRVIEPVATIGIVLLAFTFIPWLSTGRSVQDSLADRVRHSTEGLGKEMEGELKQTVDKARTIDVEKLGTQARERLKTIGTGEGETAGAERQAGETGQPAKSAIGGLIKDVGTRVRQTVEESQKQP